MISHARQSPALPGFGVIADFCGLYTIGYTFLVPVCTPYIPGIYKQIYAFLSSLECALTCGMQLSVCNLNNVLICE